MCFDQQRSLLMSELIASRTRPIDDNVMVETLRGRLAETEARLERARAREAELTRRLEEMKRFISVMEILETYLKRRFRERQAQISCRIPLGTRILNNASLVTKFETLHTKPDLYVNLLITKYQFSELSRCLDRMQWQEEILGCQAAGERRSTFQC